MTPAEIAIVISLLQAAIQQGEAMYTAAQLKDMAALQVKLMAQLEQMSADEKTANDDIDARDKALEQDLAKK